MKIWIMLFLAIAILALVIRTVSLQDRPMHTDEAVHAIKFGRLLEEGYYRYDKNDFHGPTLNYFTLLPAFLLSRRNLREMNEFTLRIVPAIFGMAITGLLLILGIHIRISSLLLAALLLAVSPALVYFSRYYIQEILLVFFTWATAFSFIRWGGSRSRGWAILTGIFMGLMMATKETWIISLGGLVVSVSLVRVINRGSGFPWLAGWGSAKDILWMVLPAIVIPGIFYSSFLSHPAGIIDALSAYGSYLNKASNQNLHHHPWYYYLDLLATGGENWRWSELFILLGGLAGFYFSLKNHQEKEGSLFLFISVFCLVTGLIYSFIPYKTPWNLLVSYTGWVMVAGYGFSMIFRTAGRSTFMRVAVMTIFLAGILDLSYLVYLENFEKAADPANPWVYGHTGTDIFTIIGKIEQIARAQPEGKDIRIDIISKGHDYWPLPWYLRDYRNIAWQDHVDYETEPASVILATPGFREMIMKEIYELPPPGKRFLYLPMFDSLTALRPGVYMEGFIRKDVWDNYQRGKDAVK